MGAQARAGAAASGLGMLAPQGPGPGALPAAAQAQQPPEAALAAAGGEAVGGVAAPELQEEDEAWAARGTGAGLGLARTGDPVGGGLRVAEAMAASGSELTAAAGPMPAAWCQPGAVPSHTYQGCRALLEGAASIFKGAVGSLRGTLQVGAELHAWQRTLPQF